MELADVIPPFFTSILRSLYSGSGRKIFSSYREAMAACSTRGYENADIVNIVVEKTKRYRDNILETTTSVQCGTSTAYSLCSVLASVQSSATHVLDFGGAAGAHYFLARSVLPSTCKLKWLVVETPAMAEAAEKHLANDELHFLSNLSEAAITLERIDLVHTSGALQYVEDPCAHLEKLVDLGAGRILLNRLGLTRGQNEVVTVQESLLSKNGPGPMPQGMSDRKVRYPYVLPRECSFMEILTRKYRVAFVFDDQSGFFPVRSEPIVGMSLLAERKVPADLGHNQSS